MNRQKYTTILSIAGSDSIGGAGIQADIKTACVNGVYAMTAVTSVTAQNTMGVPAKQDISPEIVRAQIEAVLADVTPDAIKIGMLGNPDTVAAVARCLHHSDCRNIVADPVLLSTSGAILADPLEESAQAMKELIFPLATVVTPNIPEAEFISGIKTEAEPSEELLCSLFRKFGAAAMLLKGGHGEGEELTDYLITAEGITSFISQHIATPNTHGTGCSLSTAIACGLAKGENLQEATSGAIAWLHNAIRRGADYSFGHGHGPVFYCDTNFDNETNSNNK